MSLSSLAVAVLFSSRSSLFGRLGPEIWQILISIVGPEADIQVRFVELLAMHCNATLHFTGKSGKCLHYQFVAVLLCVAGSLDQMPCKTPQNDAVC